MLTKEHLQCISEETILEALTFVGLAPQRQEREREKLI
jgi:hypothetical protein